MARDQFYRNFEQTDNLTETTLLEIEEFARGLELIEISDYYGFGLIEKVEGEGETAQYTYESEDLDESELKWVIKAFKRGRAMGKKQAVDNLFAAMKDRNGQNASLPYLKRFAEKWPGDDSEPMKGDFFVFRAEK